MTTSRTAIVPMATRRTHIASTTAKECTRHRVKHPLLSPARGLVNIEIKANCTHLQHGQAQKGLEEMFESAKEASEEPDANKWCHSCKQPCHEAAKCSQDVMQCQSDSRHDSSQRVEEEVVSSVRRDPHSHRFQRQPSPVELQDLHQRASRREGRDHRSHEWLCYLP